MRDLVLLLNHARGAVPLAPDVVPYADINQDGLVNELDAGLLANIILGLTPPISLPRAHLLKSSPAQGESDVSVTRPTVFKLTLPLSGTSVVTTNNVYATFGGRHLLSWVAISADRQTVSLFYQEPMPGAARIRVIFDGTGLTDFLGRPLDLSGDGTAGGQVILDFDTLNNNALSGTIVAGRVFASELATSPGSTNDVNQPLGGATITVDGQEQTLRAVTDQFGNFRLDPAPSGNFFVHIDGRTATNAVPGGGYPNGAYYPYVGKEWTSRPGEEVNIGNIYLPLIAAGTLQSVSATGATTVTFPSSVLQQYPGLNGVSLTVPANDLFSDDGTRGGRVGLAPVPPDRLPSPLPLGLQFSLVITVQSDGPQNFDQPVPCCFPNLPDPATGQVLPSGAKTALWSFNHRDGRWEIQGPMTVSADGHLVCTDPGVGISFPGWHGVQAGSVVKGGSIQAGGGQPKGPYEKPGASRPPACPMAGQPCPQASTDDGNVDPVYLFSGEFYDSVEDLRIKGRGFDFVWARKYRSRAGPNSAQGNGWDSSYNAHLAAQGNDLVLYDGNSRADVYPQQPDGTWSQRGFFRQLIRNTDATYTLTFEDQSTWQFYALDGSASAGKLSSIQDRNGNQMTLAYDITGRLAKFVDTLGRAIVVGYDSSGMIATITDFSGRVVRYTYFDGVEPGGNRGDLKSVTTPTVTSTPNGNDFPNGKTVSYTYSTGFADERLNHNLLTITDGRRNDPADPTFGSGPYLVNIYATTTDPQDPDFDRVVRQIWGGQSIDLVYVPILPSNANGNAIMKTIVRDRNAHVKEYFFDAQNRTVRRREYTGQANPQQPSTELSNRPTGKLRPGDPSYFETIYEWNDDSLLTRQTQPNGNVTEYVFESDLNPQASQRTRGNMRIIRRSPGSHQPAGDQPVIEESFEYDTDFGGCCGFNFVTRRTDGRGNSTFYFYDPRGNRIRTQHRISAIIEDWEYNSYGQLTAHVLPANTEGSRRRDVYYYYSSGPQTGYLQAQVTDSLHLSLTNAFQYDAVGNVVQSIDPRGHDSQKVVNSLNQVVREISREVLDGSGVRYWRDFYYDANNNLTRIDTWNVDDQGVLQSNRAFTTTFQYELLNHPIRRTDQVDDTHSVAQEFTYDPNRNLVLTRFGEAVNGNQSANVVSNLYDERDKLFQTIEAPGTADASTSQFDYDGNGNEVQVARGLEANPYLSSKQFDGYDRLVTETDPMGNVKQVSYDADHNPVLQVINGELIDVPGGGANVRLSQVAQSYDPMDRLVQTEKAFFDTSSQAPVASGSSIVHVDYSPDSQMADILDPDGNSTQYHYDTANRLTLVVDPAGNSIVTTYDSDSNVSSWRETEKSDLGNPDQVFVSSFAYDNLNRVIQTTDSGGNITRKGYDSRNNVLTMVDARGNVLHREFDGLGRLTRISRVLTTTGDGTGTIVGSITTRNAWDDSSRLVSQTDANGNGTTYAYDSLNRLTSTTFADGTTRRLTYDVHGAPLLEVDPNGTRISSAYDSLNRLVRKDIVPGPGVSAQTTFEVFRFDGLSRLVSASNNVSLAAWSYNSRSQVTTETLNGVATQSTFDPAGNAISNTYPGGRIISRLYDRLNRASTISDQNGMIAQYHYLGPWQVERIDYGNQTQSIYQYDLARRVARISISKGATLYDDRSYTWTPSYRKAVVNAPTEGATTDFSYDSIDRLVGSTRTPTTGSAQTLAYTLDGANNRTAVTGSLDAGAYNEDATLPQPADAQLNQYSRTPFDQRQYDANGNLIQTAQGVDTRRIAYNYKNQMVQWTDSVSGFTMTCTYDAIGRRIQKDRTGSQPQSTKYLYLGWQLCEEMDSSGATLATYVYGNYVDEPLNMRRAGSDFFYGHDQMYNITLVTDGTGSLVERNSYGDFGQPTVRDAANQSHAQSTVGNPFLFTGQTFDPETGLYLYRTRYLDPRAGRFTSRDWIGLWGDRNNLGNAYAYAGNDPANKVDPNGLDAWVLSSDSHAEIYLPIRQTNCCPWQKGIDGCCPIIGYISYDYAPANGAGWSTFWKALWTKGAVTRGRVNPSLPIDNNLVRVRTGCDAEAKMLAYAEATKASPGNYNPLTHSCVDFVQDTLSAGGLEGPALGWTTQTPSGLRESLQAGGAAEPAPQMDSPPNGIAAVSASSRTR